MNHYITKRAEDIANRLTRSIPRDQLLMTRLSFPGAVPYYRWPLSLKLVFTTTAAERTALAESGRGYNQRHPDDPLLAHGTGSADTLCQIILGGTLIHSSGIETYGSLSAGTNTSVQVGGYYDNGWGVFIVKRSTLEHVGRQKSPPAMLVRLTDIEGIIVPTQMVSFVQAEFPEQVSRIYGHKAFAERIDQF